MFQDNHRVIKMAEKERREAKVTGNLSIESMKVIAESVGISGFSDSAAEAMGQDATYRLKQMIQVSQQCDTVLWNYN